MNTELIKEFMGIVQRQSLHCFINPKFELIVEPKYNVYFNVEHVDSTFDLQCKVLNWLSRPAHKGCSPYYTKRIKAIINEFLSTEFDYEAMGTIYAHLGNEVNPQLTKYFIHSGFDLNTFLMLNDGEITGKSSQVSFINDIAPQAVVFHGMGGIEILRLETNGDIFVHGKLVENDKEVVNGMRTFLSDHLSRW